MGEREYGMDLPTIDAIAAEIADVQSTRRRDRDRRRRREHLPRHGRRGRGMDRATADYAGMLATLLNALALQDALERAGAHTRVQSAIDVARSQSRTSGAARSATSRRDRIVHLRRGHRQPVLHDRHGGGAALARDRRAGDPHGKHGVEGVYDGDPSTRSGREFLPALTYLEAIERGLKVMDTTALSLCMDNDIPIHVFEQAPGNIRRVVAGERVGTIISKEGGQLNGNGGGVHRGRGRAAWTSRSTTRATSSTPCAPAARRAALLDRITVDYYGTPTPLKQLATINVPEPRMLTIQPFDPSSIKAIEKAIQESDLGLQPSNDGKLVRLPVPQLTEERRKELVKVVRHMAEEHRVAVREVRRDALRHLQELVKNGEVGDDDERRAEQEVQKLTDAHTKTIDELLKHKEAEIMEV